MSHQSDLPPHVPSCVSTGAGVTVTDATATPRTQAFLCSSRNEDDISAFMETIERELTAAKAEIARLTSIGPVSGASGGDVYSWLRDARVRAERAEADLALAKDDATHQVSVIAKLDADNAQLRAEVERLKESYDGACQAEDVLSKCVSAAEEANDQLRARVAAMEQLLGEIAAVIHERTEGHTVVYSDRLRPLLPRIDAARARKGAT